MKFTKHTVALLLAGLLLGGSVLTEHVSAAVPAGLFDLFKKEETAETEPLPEDITPKRGKNSPCRKEDTAPQCPRMHQTGTAGIRKTENVRRYPAR